MSRKGYQISREDMARLKKEAEEKLAVLEFRVKRKRARLKALKKQGWPIDCPEANQLRIEIQRLATSICLVRSKIKDNITRYSARIIDDNGTHHWTPLCKRSTNLNYNFKKLQNRLIEAGVLSKTNIYHPQNMKKVMGK